MFDAKTDKIRLVEKSRFWRQKSRFKAIKKGLILRGAPVNLTSLHFMKAILLPTLQAASFFGPEK